MKNKIKIRQKKFKICHIIVFVIWIFSFLFFPFCFENHVCFAENTQQVSQKKFAKAKENCFLFKTSDTTSSSYSNIFFCVPESYFVTILSEPSSSVFKVEYKGKIGFVSSDTVTVVSFVPVVPTLDDVFVDVSSVSGTQLRSSPSAENSSNVLRILQAGTKNLEYVSFIYAEKPTGGNSDVWFFVVFFPEDDPTAVFEGYVYSEKTCNLTSFSQNLENNPELKIDSSSKNQSEISLNKNIRIVLLVLILLPIVLVLLIAIFKAKNKFHKTKSVSEDFQNEKINDNFKTSKKSVSSLKGKHFVLKDKNRDSESEFETEISPFKPSFPTFEIVDDDDLL